MELGADTRRRSSGREEEDEELLRRRQLQEEQLMKLNSGLGQLILKEEMEKERESRERASLSASRYDSPINSGEPWTPSPHSLSREWAPCLQGASIGCSTRGRVSSGGTHRVFCGKREVWKTHFMSTELVSMSRLFLEYAFPSHWKLGSP